MNGGIILNFTKRLILKAILTVVLVFGVTTISGVAYSTTVEAAVATPSVKEASKTLYVGYNTFKIKLLHLSKKYKVTYKSSNNQIASVTSKGIIKPVSAGTTSINATVKQDNKIYHLKVTITVKNPSTKLTQSVSSLYKGDTYQFKAITEGTDKKVEWSVSDTSIADITAQGKLTALASGSVTVNAKAGISSAECKVDIAKKELSSKDIYSLCNASTVEVIATDEYGEALGSGFFISDKTIVTNYHVIEGANKLEAVTYDNKKYEIKNILGYSEDIDLAVLELDADYDYLDLCKEPVQGGENVYTFGSPLGLNSTMTKGMVSNASRVIENVNYIQIDASISHGNSGGPLVNVYGEVVGVNTMYYADGQNLNFAININELKKITTDKPITVADYYTKYEKDYEEWFNANIIKEDPTKSQSKSTCQEIPSGYGVEGTIKSSEYADCYYINVTSPGNIAGILETDTLSDLTNTYFELYTYSGTKICGSKQNDEKLYESFYKYINPDEYIIFIYLPDGYSGPDVDYGFVLSY